MMGSGYAPHRARRDYIEEGLKMQKEGHDTRLIKISINRSQDNHTHVTLPQSEPVPGRQSSAT